MERTAIIMKPDAVNRDMVGRILTRFEEKGLKIVALKMEQLKPYVLKEHYVHHKDKDFYEELIGFMSSIPCVLVVLEGKDAISVVRRMAGSTSGREAEPGSIRGDLSISTQQNLIHASATVEEAKKEIARFFKKEELQEYRKMNFDWVYNASEKGY